MSEPIVFSYFFFLDTFFGFVSHSSPISVRLLTFPLRVPSLTPSFIYHPSLFLLLPLSSHFSFSSAYPSLSPSLIRIFPIPSSFLRFVSPLCSSPLFPFLSFFYLLLLLTIFLRLNSSILPSFSSLSLSHFLCLLPLPLLHISSSSISFAHSPLYSLISSCIPKFSFFLFSFFLSCLPSSFTSAFIILFSLILIHISYVYHLPLLLFSFVDSPLSFPFSFTSSLNYPLPLPFPFTSLRSLPSPSLLFITISFSCIYISFVLSSLSLLVLPFFIHIFVSYPLAPPISFMSPFLLLSSFSPSLRIFLFLYPSFVLLY